MTDVILVPSSPTANHEATVDLHIPNDRSSISTRKPCRSRIIPSYVLLPTKMPRPIKACRLRAHLLATCMAARYQIYDADLHVTG